MSSPEQQTALPIGERADARVAVQTTEDTQSRRPLRKQSQRERVRRMISRGWLCGIEFLSPPDGNSPILRYSAHFHSLRREGWLIDRRECEHPWHNHRESTMYQWKLVGHVDDGTLPGIGGGL